MPDHNQLSFTPPPELPGAPVGDERTADQKYGITPADKERRESLLIDQFSPDEAEFMARQTDIPLLEPKRDVPPPRERVPVRRDRLSAMGKLAADEPPEHIAAEVRRMRGY